MKTRITELLGIEYPIIQGGMAWVAEAHLAAAVSEAGGLGLLGGASAPAEVIRDMIRQVREMTDKPFGVNVMLMSPYAKEVAQVVVEEKVPVVTTGAGNPAAYLPMWKEAGVKVIPVVASVAHARLLEKAGVRAEAFTDGRAYIDVSEFNAIKSGEIRTRDSVYVLSTRNPVDDIFAFMREHRDRIENISINYPSNEAKEKFSRVLKEIPGVTVTTSFALNNEIGGATTSKADGLLHLMGELGVKKSELMACGDSPNDGAMIEMAAVGIAMGNATPDVRAMADFVTDSNAEDGVAKAIEKFVIDGMHDGRKAGEREWK